MSALRKRSDLWRSLGHALKIPIDRIHLIGSHCQNEFDSLVEVCDAWLNKLTEENSSPTWQVVLSALEDVGAMDLVNELKSDYNTYLAQGLATVQEWI